MARDFIKNEDCETSTDPVRNMIRDISAEGMVEWMIECHGLPRGSAEVIISNLRQQFKWHRLQGRLDRSPTAAVIATCYGGCANNPKH